MANIEVNYTSDQLIEELINRHTFAGVVVWYTANAKNQLDRSSAKLTKSPPLSRQDTESLLVIGLQLVPDMFGGQS
jgi:hypothetical protein